MPKKGSYLADLFNAICLWHLTPLKLNLAPTVLLLLASAASGFYISGYLAFAFTVWSVLVCCIVAWLYTELEADEYIWKFFMESLPATFLALEVLWSARLIGKLLN